MKLCLLFTLFITLSISSIAFAQTNFSSEADLKEKAAELFEAGKLVEAEPLYAQLLSLYAKDPEYNYRYGACLLAADGDKEKAMKYLKFAISKPNSDPLAYYYLGRVHHLNYNFADAVKYYSRFKNKASTDQREKYQVERKIEMCKNGNDLLSRFNEVQVLEKQEISRKDFFRIYDLAGIDGKVITTPEDFLEKEDKKREDQYIMYLPPNAKEVYYASYGKKGENGKDIFKRVKLGNGNWSDAVNIGQSINTLYDEDYPFIHPDGRTLYFASKGHSSMGGYDLFVSTYDQSIADWTEPRNLDFAFSSADDDVLFITDKDKVLAYFASSRTNEAGKITVYKVMVEKGPANLSVIKGKFIADNMPDMTKAKITVIDKANNNTIGVYETDKNGNYQIEIANNGGEYQINLETTETAPIHTGIVTIPKQEEFEVLGQELHLVGEGSQQQLVIKNIFDGTTAQNLKNGGPVISSELLRKKASLDVNVNQDRLAEALPTTENNYSSPKPSNRSINQQAEAAKKEELKQSNKDENKPDQAAIANQEKAEGSTTLKEEISTSTSETTELKQKLEELLNAQKNQVEETKKASAHAFEQANQAQSESDKLFNQLASQKLAGVSKEEQSITQNYAQEAAAQAVFSAALGEKLDQLKKAQQEQLLTTQRQASSIKSKLANNELAEAELSFNNLEKSVDEQNNKANINSLLSEEKTMVKSQLQLNSSKVSSYKQKEQALAAEMNQINSQLENLRDAYKNSSSAKRKEIAQRMENLVLDSSDMSYQYAQAKKDYEATLKKETALGLKLQQTELVEGKLRSKMPLAESQLTANEKSTLIDELQSSVRSNKLGDYNLNKTTSFATNTNSEDSANNQNATLNAVDSDDSNQETLASKQDQATELESVESINQNFSKQLQEANEKTDEDLKNASRIKVYENWISSLEAELVKREAMLANTSNEKERQTLKEESDKVLNRLEELRSQRTQIQTELTNGKQIAAENSNADINEQASFSLNEGTPSRADNSDKSTRENSVNEGKSTANFEKGVLLESTVDVSQINGKSVISFPNSVFTFEQSFNYSSPAANSSLTEAKQALALAKDLNEQAEEAKQAAFSLGSVEERNQAFERANLLEEASKRKQVEAASQYASVNEGEYLQNASILRQANNFDIEFESSNLDIANLLAEEAEAYFNQASSIRNEVNESDRLSKIEADLQKAYDYEMLALRKQGEALNLLDVVQTEYANKEAISQNSNQNSERRSRFIQTISDAEVLAIKNAELARAKGDSLTAVVKNIESEANILKAQADDLPIGDRRDSVLAVYEELTTEAEQKRSKASVYYERETQINDGFADENQLASSSLEKPLTTTQTTNSINLDTVNIDDARATLILQSQAYINYVNRAQERKRLRKEADIAYELANNTQVEQLKLIREANQLRRKASSTTDQAEKERLIKEATVLDQKAAIKEQSVDSLNKLVKVKNYTIRQTEESMRNAIADLNPMEKAEVQKLALENIDATPLAEVNPVESRNDTQENSNVNSGVFTSSESSQQETLSQLPIEERIVNAAESSTEDLPPAEFANKEGNSLTNEEESSSDLLKEKKTMNAKPANNNQNKENSESVKELAEEESAETVTNENNFNIEKVNPSVEAVNRSNVNRLPRLVKQAIFMTLDQNESIYSPENPIPVITKKEMPEGLIYKIQVGAFRNPIPQNLFKGFAPLLAEKTASGITRYTAGIFLTETQAIYARDEIRKLGYSDAFVVAFLNGERISISQAREEKPKQAAGGLGEQTSPTIVSNNSIKTASSEISEKLPAQFSSENVQLVKHVNSVDGLFYTVQIGVFSKPVKKGTFTLSQLTVKPLAGGLSRYNSGVFRTAVAAENAKNKIIKEVPDAFVTAYYKGKRITLAEAARIENQ